MNITLNGQDTTLDAPLTLAELIERHKLTPTRVAIEVNEQLVRRAEFADRQLKPGDRVEIVTLVGGG